ncbi:hypothetical protein SDRG_09809 [Saprolegnia diclina VS20]|uniref:MATE efflux family protein n=1 Tax=Saprolegnia diclina (strain VS20) TaxID=1156394 RepID=T0RR15_SAPDV|nr:hypothetical protein SDRG_09809 [Saprolegnia diclina VS20]EQC32482.1 hypothetical protein SDRG_09809 [Saprolegnia diclina VS20]|eukprot:XP_008613983.1 hypothetical protein SDRG_09809 [Saprolegnia diclina VS20]
MASEASTLISPPAPFQYEDGIQPHVVLPLHREFGAVSLLALRLSVRSLPRHLLTLITAAVLGHLGTRELAAAALAQAWIGLPTAFMHAAIAVVTKLCAQAKGAGYNVLLGTWLQTSLVFALVGAIPVMLWHYFVGDMIGLSVDDAATVRLGRTYAQVASLGVVPDYLFCALAAFFDTHHVVVPTTVASFAAVLVHLAATLLLVPAYGVAGAAMAGAVSTVFRLGVFAAYTLLWKRYHAKFWGGWSWACIEHDYFLTFAALAVPSGAAAAMDYVPLTLMGTLSGYLGYPVAAAHAILLGLFGVISAVIHGAAAATQARMTRYLGQGCARSARRVLSLGTVVVGGATLVLLSLLLPLQTAIVSLWTRDVTVQALCANALDVFVFGVAATLARALLGGALVALAMGDVVAIVSVLGRICVLIPLCVFMPISLAWGLTGFWYAIGCAETIQALLLCVAIARLNWHLAAQRVQYITPPSSSSMRRIVLV